MRKLIVRRLHGDESGVTLVIVALCLVSLIGMIVLVVDVGGLLLNRRAMVNASDAAALSAAKSCILPPSMDPQTPEQAADALAADNSGAADVSNPSNILQSSGCDTADTGYVTVQYGASQQLFFAGLFGQGQGHVTTQATAIWGPAGSVNPMPIVIYEDSFQNCEFDAIDPNKTCYVWEDNNNVNNSQSSFGLLDLRTDKPSQYGWNSDPGVTCSDPGGAIDQWITNYPDPSIGDLPLNYPNPTYVCRASGNRQSTWDDLANSRARHSSSRSTVVTTRCPATSAGNCSPSRVPRRRARRRPASTTSSGTSPRNSSSSTSPTIRGQGGTRELLGRANVPRA